MKWLVCKAEHEFNHEQDCSMFRAVECMQVFNLEEDAEEARDLFQRACEYFDYIVINSDQIGELVR